MELVPPTSARRSSPRPSSTAYGTSPRGESDGPRCRLGLGPKKVDALGSFLPSQSRALLRLPASRHWHRRQVRPPGRRWRLPGLQSHVLCTGGVEPSPMTWPIHGLPLGALGLWFKLRLYRSRWPRKAPTVAFAYRWGGRERIRAWLSELAAASLVELRRGDEPLDAVTGPAESIVVVVRHWEPPIPEAISRSRQRWRLRKRRQSERLTPSFTPSATPPFHCSRGGWRRA